MDYEWCISCDGTGISASGSLESNCHKCNGTGQIEDTNCYFEDKFDEWRENHEINA